MTFWPMTFCPICLLSLRNKKVELVPYFILYLVKWKYWDDSCRENEILAYTLLSLRNKKVELVPWFKIWYVNIVCFVFGKMKVLECSLSRKRDFSLYGYMFDKYEGWACPSTSLDAKHDIWIYLVLNSVNIKYWDDPCCEKEILAYMVANLINVKVEFLPWFNAWFVNLFGCVFDKIKVLEWPLCILCDYKFEK